MSDDLDYDTLRALAEDVCKFVTFSASEFRDTEGKPLVDADFVMDSGVEIKRTFRAKKANTLPMALAMLKQHLRQTEKAAKSKKRTAGAKMKKDNAG